MNKPTLATVKSFVKANRANLQIMVESSFDGMVDCCTDNQNARFRVAQTPENGGHKNQLGIRGAWFVFGSRDLITPYNENGFVGYSIYNCCGSFVLAIPAERVAA